MMDAQGASNQFYQYPKTHTLKQKSAELKKAYPAYGQGFPDKQDQDIIPPVTWLQVPVTSGLPEGQAEVAKHAELDKIVTDYLTKWKLPGGCNLALVSATKGVLYNKGFGVRSVTDDQLAPMTPDCLMYCGSVSKTITSVAIMCLVEDGALTLDQPILALICKKASTTDVPDLKDPRVANITVKMCMNHTAGFSDNSMGTEATNIPTCDTARTFLSQVMLNRDPGTSHEYSNLGPNLLGRVIEAALPDATHCEQYIQSRVFAPLGIADLIHSKFSNKYSNVPKVSSGYEPCEMEPCTYTPTEPGTIADDLSNLRWKYLFGGAFRGQGNKDIGMEGAGGWKMTSMHGAAMGADLMKARDGEDGEGKIFKKQATARAFFSSDHGCPEDATYGDPKQGWYGLGTIGWAPDKTKCTAESGMDVSGGAQWMHGGTFGSGLHMGCVGVSWFFALTAQPHFTGEHTIHHIHAPDGQGLKDLIRTFVQGGGCN